MGVWELDGMDKEDSKGGRPPKDDQTDSKEPINTHPLTADDDPEELTAQVIVEEIVGDPEDKIGYIAEHLAISPIEVRKILEEIGHLETDWEEYTDKYKICEDDARIPTNEISSSSVIRDEWKQTDDEVVFTDEDSSSRVDESSGLGAMLEREK